MIEMHITIESGEQGLTVTETQTAKGTKPTASEIKMARTLAGVLKATNKLIMKATGNGFMVEGSNTEAVQKLYEQKVKERKESSGSRTE